jgi:5-methylcytosine-specific restriction endonuclease McrA
MKEKILKLRSEGKSYNEIVEILGCSKSTVCYHCGTGQKDKTNVRTYARRKRTVISQRVESFHNRSIKDRSEDFQRERLAAGGLGKRNLTFRWQDVIAKFGWETKCYLTGREIDIKNSKGYHFDHMIPVSKGGSSSLDNLGITCKQANQAKNNMSIDEFIQLSKEVLEHHGYKVEKVKE